MNSNPCLRFRVRSLVSLFLVGMGLTSSSSAATITFQDQGDWADALGGASITVLGFNGVDETHGRRVDHPTLDAYYSSQGVEFLPFAGTTAYPVILRGQQYQISTPGRDGLLANSSSPNSGQAGRAILFDFTTTIRAVGGFSNNIDRGLLEAYDTNGVLLGTASIGFDGRGGFGGLVSDTPIARVKLINTFNGDLTWGVYDLQFSAGPTPVATPDGGTTAGLVLLGLLSLAHARRR